MKITNKHFLDFFDLQETIVDLGILAYIFKREECTALELINNLEVTKKNLKKKLKIIRNLGIIKYSKQETNDFDSLIIHSTDQLGFFFKEFYNQVISKEVKDHENENQYYILDEKGENSEEKIKKKDNFIIVPTPKLGELLNTIDYIVKSTEKELRERGYL